MINREGECNLVILVYLECPVLLVQQLPCQLLKNYKNNGLKIESSQQRIGIAKLANKHSVFRQQLA